MAGSALTSVSSAHGSGAIRGADPRPEQARRPALASLTSLRALAAAGVFVSHAGFFVGRTDLTGPISDLAYNYVGGFSVGRFYRKRLPGSTPYTCSCSISSQLSRPRAIAASSSSCPS